MTAGASECALLTEGDETTYRLSTEPPFIVQGRQWIIGSESLGGCFYDYIRNSKDDLVGIRYWLNPGVDPYDHPVLGRFVEDKRVVISKSKQWVDLLFRAQDVKELRSGQLVIDTVQDFGGDCVMHSGVKYGLLFSIAF